MPPDEPRRYLVAVGIGAYDSTAWPPLDEANRELDLIVKLLTSDRFRYQRILGDQSEGPERDRLLRALVAWCGSAERKIDDHLIVYWTGHGEVQGERLYLVLPGTTDVLADGLKVEDMVTVLLGNQSRVGQVLLILDICFSGQGLIDVGERLGALTRARPANAPIAIAVICATGSRSHAVQLVFAEAFVGAVESSADPDKRLPPALDLFGIVQKMNAPAGRTGMYPYFFTGRSQSLFLRNPYHISHWPSGIDTRTEALLARLDVAARGVASPETEGWYFKGRKRVFAELCRWLSAEQRAGLCRISGGVGAGKSAVLARLYTLNLEDYRRHVPPNVLAETDLPPVASIDAIILLSRKRPLDVIKEIGEKLGVVASTADEIVVELEKRGRRPVLLVDGLDEADMPEKTYAILETISQKTVKVIVGARSPCTPGIRPPEMEIDLDTAPWKDLDAVRDYVTQRLQNELGDDGAAGRMRGGDLGHSVRAIVERAKGNFLLASLIVTAMISRTTDDPGDPDWAFPETVGEAFDQIFAGLLYEESAVRDLLVPLAYAEGKGLPKGELWGILATRLGAQEYHRSDIDLVFKKVPWFVVEDLYDGGSVYRLFHIALAEHLQTSGPAEKVHAEIAANLRECLGRPDDEGLSPTQDAVYARRYLTTHLRRAHEWHELGHLVTDPSWIASKSSRLVPFESEDLAADMEEAQQAARDANARTAKEELELPALAESVWGLLWRSRHVTLVDAVPPAAWPILVQAKELTPERSLRLLASVGNETLVASRLAALARVFQGADLDRLLDFAEGISELPVTESAERPADTAPRKPLELYEAILANALSGNDGRRVARRALEAAALVDGNRRFLVLEAAMPHLDADQLDEARDLIDSMGTRGDQRWHALANSVYTAECVRRGDARAVVRAESLDRDSLAWWFTAAALFALKKEGRRDLLGGLRLTDEIARAERSIDDWYYRLQVMSSLTRALPGVRSESHRAALAACLRCLHSCTKADSVVLQSARVASCLPNTHRMRLLRWAKYRLAAARRDDHPNLNWSHTPPALACAFAGAGDLASALSIALQTEDHEFYRPRAFEDVAWSFRPKGQRTPSASFHLSSPLFRAVSPYTRLQFWCTRFDSLEEADRLAVFELLGRIRIEFGEDVHLARCGVIAERARHASVGEIEILLQPLLDIWPSPPTRLLQRFARNCAAACHLPVALQILEMIEPEDRVEIWADVLAAASHRCTLPLFENLLRIPDLFQEIVKRDKTRVVLDLVRRAPAEWIETLARAATTLEKKYAEGFPLALAMRAFELGMHAIAEPLLHNREATLLSLFAVSALDSSTRRAFIGFMNASCQLPAPESRGLFDLVARLLSVNESEMGAVSSEVIDFLKLQQHPTFRTFPEQLVELLEGSAIVELVTMAFEARIDRITAVSSEYLSFDFDHSFAWMLPLLDAGQLNRLRPLVQRLDDDYVRDEAMVALLPHFAKRHGLTKALALRNDVKRYGFQAKSWGALWHYLPRERQSEVFSTLIPRKVVAGGCEATVLGELAPALAEPDFVRALRWIIQNHRGDEAGLLAPLVEVACGKPRKHGIVAWDTITTEAARLHGRAAMACLSVALPLAEHLGGPKALVAIDELLAKATSQWSVED